MPTPQERDFLPGHPAAADYNPASPEAQEWARKNIHPEGERDFPPDHPKALDTPGNKNHYTWVAGVDPAHPELEPFSGRTPEQAKAHRDFYLRKAKESQPTPPREPIVAPAVVPDPSKQRARKLNGSKSVAVFCPACKSEHVFDTRWTFNGSLELPTFQPSMMVNGDDDKRRCHSYVTNGQIQFLADSGHALRGQTVELPSVGSAQETINA
jgi:hypothetical protein